MLPSFSCRMAVLHHLYAFVVKELTTRVYLLLLWILNNCDYLSKFYWMANNSWCDLRHITFIQKINITQAEWLYDVVRRDVWTVVSLWAFSHAVSPVVELVSVSVITEMHRISVYIWSWINRYSSRDLRGKVCCFLCKYNLAFIYKNHVATLAFHL
jgi:hypothetical protein